MFVTYLVVFSRLVGGIILCVRYQYTWQRFEDVIESTGDSQFETLRDGVTSFYKMWPKLKSLGVHVPPIDARTAGEETVENALEILKSLRLSNCQPFKCEVWY